MKSISNSILRPATNRAFRGVLLLVFAAFTVFTACDLALGERVNTIDPKISIPEDSASKPGAYLFGADNKVEIQVDSEVALAAVWMDVEYTDLNGNKRQTRLPAYQENGKWFVNIDTTDMKDGNIAGTITAVASKGERESTTTEIVFVVKNAPPIIEMTLPKIRGEDGENGSYNYPDLNSEPPVDVVLGSDLMGIASDLMGIKQGYPQIMFWPVSAYANGIPPASDPKWGQWRTLTDDKWRTLTENGGKAVQFRWPLVEMIQAGGSWKPPELVFGSTDIVDLQTGRYRFKVRVMDLAETLHTYPDLKVNDLEPKSPNDYIEINLIAATSPIIRFAEFPQYYNGRTNLVVKVMITSPNALTGVYAKVDPKDLTEFGPDDTGSWIYHERTNGMVYEYTITMPPTSFDSGDTIFHVRAVDNLGQETVTSRAFIVDTIAPSLEYIEPSGLGSSKPRVTSTVTFRGVATDNQRVKKMYYALGRTETAAANMDPVAATDTTWHDTQLDTVPTSYHPGKGNLDASWSGSLSSWSWRFDNIAQVCRAYSPDGIGATESGESGDPNGNHFVYGAENNGYLYNLWELPIKFKVVDIADNVQFFDVRVIVDPDADMPSVEISSHPGTAQANYQTVGGPVRINGTARDNDWIHHVEVRVLWQTNEQCDTTAVPTTVYKDWAWVYSEIETTTVTPPARSSSISWYHNINSNKDLEAPDNYDIRLVILEFRAVDASLYNPGVPKNENAPVERVYFKIDKTVPVIENVRILRGKPSPWTVGSIATLGAKDASTSVDYVPGETRVAEFVVLIADIRDDNAVKEINLRGINPPIQPENYIAKTSISATDPWVTKNSSDDKSYTLYIPIDTTGAEGGTKFGSGYQNIAGVYNMELQVLDNSTPTPYMAQNTFSLQIDNYYPFIEFSGNLNAVGDYTIEGETWDTGTGMLVEGVERVVVYFTKGGWNGAGVPLASGQSYATSSSQKVISGRAGTYQAVTSGKEGTLISSLANFPNVKDANGNFATTYSGIVIDNDLNNNGSFANTNFSGSTYVNWSVRYPSTNLPDGPITLNYVVFDKAGNATHNYRDIYIANNRPVISTIYLRTDIDADGFTTGVEPSKPNEEVTRIVSVLEDPNEGAKANFRVRNKRFHLRLGFSDASVSVPPQTHKYRVSHVTQGADVPISDPTNGIKKGKVYTIANLGTNVNWVNYGVIGQVADMGTTFVATGNYSDIPVSGSGGRVYYYEVVGGTTDQSDTVITATSALGSGTIIQFNDNAFGNSLIKDSAKVEGADGNLAMQNDRAFIVKVFDSTVSGGTEDEQLAHAVLIKIDIDNDDTTSPKINLAPFGQKYDRVSEDTPLSNNANKVLRNLDNSEYTDNVVTNNSGVKKGYVQYASHSSEAGTNVDPKDADISGMVIFKGKAMDNGRIRRITAQIKDYPNAGSGTEFNIAVWNGDASTLVPATTDYTIEAMRSGTANPWGFEVENSYLTMEHGHVLNWNFAWDSSLITSVVGSNVDITFRVYDFKDPEPATTSNTAGSAEGTVDVVPYILEVVTPLSDAYKSKPSAFNRSASGRYPVRENDKIEIKGFNLGRLAGGGLTAITPTVSANSVNILAANVVLNNKSSIGVRIDSDGAYADTTFNTTNAVVSGPLVVTVGGIASINNTNNPNAHYNQEPNGLNNDILTDDRSLYVWNTGYLLNQSSNVQSPFMRMHTNSRWYLTYGNYVNNTGVLTVLRTNAAGTGFDTQQVQTDQNRYLNIGMAINQAGDWFVGASNQTATTDHTFAFYAKTITGPTLNAPATYPNASNGDAHRRILRLNGNTSRVRIPRIAVYNTNGTTADSTNNATRTAISYYDGSGNDNAVFFHYGLVGGTTSTTAGFGGDIPANGGTANATTHLFVTAQTVANNSQTHEGSMYTAVGLLSNGLPVIAWYDRTNQNLVFSHGGTPGGTATTNRPLNNSALTTTVAGGATSIVSTTTAQWQSNAVIVHANAGTHVDLAVDEADNVHLAYYDVFNGGLYYALIPPTGSGNTVRPNTTSIVPVKVDTYLSAGTKIMINVRRENHTVGGNRDVPYISYFHASFGDTRNSIRVAWRKDFSTTAPLAGTDANDRFTGKWEVMTVPTGTVPLNENDIVCNGVPTTGNFRSNGGTLVNRDIAKSMLVGYMTQSWYEGAILKDSLY